jgi:hypothetical protein
MQPVAASPGQDSSGNAAPAEAPFPQCSVLRLGAAGWVTQVIVRASLVQQSAVGFVYYIPGIVATLAVVLMSLMQRDDPDYIGYGDEGDQVRM